MYTAMRPAWLVVLSVFYTNVVFCCDVPVFRYALERWDSDRYTIEVVSHGTFSQDEVDSINSALKHNADAEGGFNYVVNLVESSDHSTNGIHQVALRNPKLGNKDIITDILSEEFLQSIISSPARIEIANRLLDGETAVWIFIPCGNLDKDQAARSSLEREIERLEGILTLPEHAEVITGDEIKLDANADLRIDFSVLEIQKKDPKEQVLIASLLASELDLVNFQDEPMAFPVFGRGRALYALIGEGINQEMIEKAGRFLTAACTCQVKELNPGIDLLMPVHWDSAVKERLVKDVIVPPPFEGLAQMVAEENQNSATLIVASSILPNESSEMNYIYIIGSILFLFILVDLIYFFGIRKRNNH